MTRQAVHQLVGPGVSDGMRVAVVCVDGVRSMVTQRDGSEPRCPRCKAHLKRINYGGVVIGSIGAIAEPIVSEVIRWMTGMSTSLQLAEENRESV